MHEANADATRRSTTRRRRTARAKESSASDEAGEGIESVDGLREASGGAATGVAGRYTELAPSLPYDYDDVPVDRHITSPYPMPVTSLSICS